MVLGRNQVMKKISRKVAVARGLPKWPQMLVDGDPVTPEQAKEIILHTDTFLTDPGSYGGNNRGWNQWAKEVLGYDWIEDKYDLQDQFRHESGFLGAGYVHNNWASCSFIGGPHGWCHPNGVIRYRDNVGKWPSVGCVADDWSAIAARWPFLSLHVTLMNCESCEDEVERKPVVTMRVHAGKVSFFEGTLEHHADIAPQPVESMVANFAERMSGGVSREQGLPDEWIKDLGNITRPIVFGLLGR